MAVQDGRGDDPDEQANRTRYLAKCVLKSSVVLHAVYGHIRCPSTSDVVLGKVYYLLTYCVWDSILMFADNFPSYNELAFGDS
jgi:hypothetical protein